ncbi:MAG: radical SAM protein [Anaerolineales bacterium]|nr:radical SAM protein [Anaerolineales bacterium]
MAWKPGSSWVSGFKFEGQRWFEVNEQKVFLNELSPQDIGIILTYQCHSGCKHCLYNCGPRWEREPMSPQTLEEALDAVTLWSHPPQVHLTGGEPFLHFDLLLQGVQQAVVRRITCYVETSASWCTDEKEAVERFARLRDAGLQAVLISCSPFHAEKIPPARTLKAVQAALAIFGPRGVIVYQPEYLELIQRFDLDRPTPLTRYEEVFGDAALQRILWQGYGIISGGRSGYQLGRYVPRKPAESFRGMGCAGAILYAHHSHFDLYGNYISGFCGGLSVGSWRVLSQVLEDFQAGRYPSLIEELVERGPHGLYEMAQRRFDYRPLSEGYAGKCHLCVDVRRHLVEAEDFPELKPRGFYEHV